MEKDKNMTIGEIIKAKDKEIYDKLMKIGKHKNERRSSIKQNRKANR